MSRQTSYLSYNLALTCCSPLLAAYLLNRYLSGKSRPGWSERWGSLPAKLTAKSNERPRIWVHAVSAGEVVAATPILSELRKRLPAHEILLSVITPAGYEMAEKQASSYIDGLFYFPFDLPWVVSRVVKKIKPTVFVTMESELWPNLLHNLKRFGARTVMVNGRITAKNFRRASTVGKRLFLWMLSNMDRLMMQSELDADRIRQMGRFAESDRIEVIGNSKFDQEIPQLQPEQIEALRLSLKLPDSAPVFIAGSTRSVEEEAIVIAAYLEMRRRFPNLCLIIAPRHLNRVSEVVNGMESAGLSPVRRTQAAEITDPIRHLILDTLGELATVYAVADLVFVGNTFPPVVQGGGQNLLQPLAQGKPVLFGPLIATIRAEAGMAIEAGVGFQIADEAALAQEGIRLLEDGRLRDEIAVKARSLIAANQGVSARYACRIAELASL